MDGVREILRGLGTYKGGADAHGQMDQYVVDRCNELAAKPDLTAADIKVLLDACVHGSLCTDFVIGVLDIARNQAEQ